jgi:hypothetical protein
MNSVSLILIACAIGVGAQPNCGLGRRVEVAASTWPTPMGCVVAAPQLAAAWAAANHGWRPVETRCVPTVRLAAELSELEGEDV